MTTQTNDTFTCTNCLREYHITDQAFDGLRCMSCQEIELEFAQYESHSDDDGSCAPSPTLKTKVVNDDDIPF